LEKGPIRPEPEPKSGTALVPTVKESGEGQGKVREF